ncbi:thioredoxin domain-containing protein [Homoserinibacter sp. GY 40078]|uniref:thioredoxin domain-containing protein n=1 Tax=Homoserinibacter sp. GY 40078 TaxID=2603275 RepID=UPI0011CA5AE6|nr:DUF255 domain-containing protein [Homoserinibacter sp. GY 40078]TXK19464.1 thioredoxin domain-containing protein [Homoserinibacter sp. GY 40078]
MGSRLASAISPYLQAHADNPVDWWPWGEGAFAEAARRDIPVMVSIGYATCHWCHVMARESFSDPEVAAYLDEHLVAVKVDREEHPEVDAAFIAAASAFTPHLGWPLTVFATPEGRVFFAGTYFPPEPVRGAPSFRQVLEAIVEAWTERRAEVEATGAAVAEALAARPDAAEARLPTPAALRDAAIELASFEDPQYGGFGSEAKFPNAPAVSFLAELGRQGDEDADALGRRLFQATAALRDPVEGGAFRYAVQRDWTEPHYERMLSDNALLLDLATGFGDALAAEQLAGFLLNVLRLPDGAFASAQDSESLIDGERSEGGYYALDAASRAGQQVPAIDEKVLAGLNGLAIGALADAGVRFARPEWVDAARHAADAVEARLVTETPDGPRLARAARDGRVSDAAATLEDYGGLAGGLVRLALAAGDPAPAARARALVAACIDGERVRPPGGGDPVLAARGIAVEADLSEGAVPSGAALFADAALRLSGLDGDTALARAAELALAPVVEPALARPIAFGAALATIARLVSPPSQLVIVVPDEGAASELVVQARAWATPGRVLAIVTDDEARAFADAGFELFHGRSTLDGASAAYLCEGTLCLLPTDDPAVLAAQLAATP